MMTTAELNACKLGTKVIDVNGNVYTKGQHELPWKCEDNRYSSVYLANHLRGGVQLVK